jgi:GntR family transcriptional regulator
VLVTVGPPVPPPHRADGPVRAGIPEHGRVPRYYAVKVELLDLVDKLGQGAMLPSERELAERYSVSRLTLRQAVSELVLEGRLVRRQGSGTFVSPPKLTQPLALVSYTEGMRQQGVEPGRSAVTVEHLPADELLAEDLAIEPGAVVLHLERVLTADGERVGLESTYLPERRFPDLLGRFDPTTSLYAFLRDELGVEFAEARERLETVLATPREALLIGTNPALPMLLLHRVSYDRAGVPIERVRSLYRGDRFSFVTRLRAES